MDSKKLAVWIFVGGISGFIVAVLGFYWWDRGALPGFQPTIVDVSIEVDRAHCGGNVGLE